MQFFEIIQMFDHHFILQIDRTDTFVNLREVSKRILLPEGRYCIIPCTFKQGEESNFLLRVFVEKQWGSSEGGHGHDVTEEMDSTTRLSRRDRPDGATAAPISDIDIQTSDKSQIK